MLSNYYYIAGLAARMTAGPVTAILILDKFSPLNQGYYYLVLSLVSSVTLFEAGLTMLMVRDGTKKNGEPNLKIINLVSRVLEIIGFFYLLTMLIIAPLFFLEHKTFFESIYLAAIIGLAGFSQIYMLSTISKLEAFGEVVAAFKIKFITTVLSIIVNILTLYFFERVESLAFGYIVTGLSLRATTHIPSRNNENVRFIYVKYYLVRNRKILFSYLSGYFLWSAMPVIVSAINNVETAGKYSISSALMMAIYQLYQTVYVTQRRRIIQDVKNGATSSDLSGVKYVSIILCLTLAVVSLIIAKILELEYSARFLNLAELLALSLYLSALFGCTQKMNILRYAGGEPVFRQQLTLNFCLPALAAIILFCSDSIFLMIIINFLLVSIVNINLKKVN